jgi:glycerophosphoryl diester phosphodiesterase
MRRAWLIGVAAMLALASFIYVNNTSLLAGPRPGKHVLLAHRGLHQTFHTRDLRGDTCTATRIHPPEHGYLENTIASMQAAFDAGADIVELDIHPTTDGQFAVFHDWTLDCRTDGKGVTREHTLAELKALDIGYGYTADGGKTFPFRGKGVGLMPSLDEVLGAFPGKGLLVNVKSNDPAEGEMLANHLLRLPRERLSRIMVYGGDRPIQVLRARVPHLVTMSRESLRTCGLGYIALAWSGYVPAACRNSLLLVPVNFAPWLWGWPRRLLARMEAAGTEVFVTGPWAGGAFSRGIDDATTFQQLPAGYTGGVWTNRIERIAPLAGAPR